MSAIEAPDFEAALIAAVEHRHPRYTCYGRPDGWSLVTGPEPCEKCGTTVVAMRSDVTRSVSVCEIGEVRSHGRGCPMPFHTPAACKAQRVKGGLW